jgi:hypothetical protein
LEIKRRLDEAPEMMVSYNTMIYIENTNEVRRGLGLLFPPLAIAGAIWKKKHISHHHLLF